MPFKKGQIANPFGQRRKMWLKQVERTREAKETWSRLLRLRDDMVLERKEVPNGDGGVMLVDVVVSAKDYLACCKEILNRCVGLPKQEVDVSASVGVHDDRGSIRVLVSDPKAIELARELTEIVITKQSSSGASQ